MVTIQENLFIKEITPESSYILGLLWADGYVYKNNKANSIRLDCIKDDGLIYYNTFLKTGNWKIQFSQRKHWKEQSHINTNNKNLVNYLLENNYGPHNKETCLLLNNIPENLRHYWYRGYVDGDGCWGFYPKLQIRVFNATSHIEQNWIFFETILNNLNINYKINKRIHTAKGYKKSELIILGKNNLINFGNYIYKDFEVDNIGLPRKYNKWKTIINSYIK